MTGYSYWEIQCRNWRHLLGVNSFENWVCTTFIRIENLGNRNWWHVKNRLILHFVPTFICGLTCCITFGLFPLLTYTRRSFQWIQTCTKDVWAHNTGLTSPLLLKCLYRAKKVGVLFSFFVSTIFRLHYPTFPTIWYFFSPFSVCIWIPTCKV